VKLKPVITLILIVVVPLVLLAWVGLRLVRHERQLRAQQVRDLLTDRLRDIDRRIATHFQELAADMHKLTAIDTFHPNQLREAGRSDARVFQLFVIRPDGGLLYPDPLGPLNRNEQEFLSRASQIVTDRELQRAAAAQEAQSEESRVESQQSGSGWFVWYWGRGLNLVYWQRQMSGHLVAAALDRSRWIADLIAALPDTPDSHQGAAVASQSQIRLVDSTSKPVYQWGPFEPPAGAAAACAIGLSPPMDAWRLEQFVPTERLLARSLPGVYFNLATGLGASAVGLVVLALYFYRDYAREIREAGQRVSFVNQVSHELRSPLTNIRMYADLVEADLDGLPDEAADEIRPRLGVIQSESQRLSRLIGNVLTFARQQRKTLRLSFAPCCIDQVVQDVLARFRPVLAQLGVQCEFAAGAGRIVSADADAVQQIVGNLISNVEKYAAAGRWMGIATRQEGGRTIITVADRGPGVDPALRETIFEPFWRGDHGIRGVAGTGIGLAIARELARLHGGDVTLVLDENSSSGCLGSKRGWLGSKRSEAPSENTRGAGVDSSHSGWLGSALREAPSNVTRDADVPGARPPGSTPATPVGAVFEVVLATGDADTGEGSPCTS
jgi:signal transduction histidine kinase